MKTPNPTEKIKSEIEKLKKLRELTDSVVIGLKLEKTKAQLSQRQNDVKSFVEFLEKVGNMEINQNDGTDIMIPFKLYYRELNEKLAELKQEINNG